MTNALFRWPAAALVSCIATLAQAGGTGLAGSADAALQGPPAAAGVIALVCPNGNTTPTSPGGHYIDCGDGTLIDSSTNLMWEKKRRCDTNPNRPSDAPNYANPHCDLNTYSWVDHTTQGIQPTGTLFTDFLLRLNGNVSADAVTPCFARHCDWRIPTIYELNGLVEKSAAGCSSGAPCIDPAFLPTIASYEAYYWTNTQLALTMTNPPDPAFYTWVALFGSGGGYTFIPKQTSGEYARAVRGGR